MEKTFYCPECGEELLASALSAVSLAVSGKRSRAQALDVLAERDTICEVCQWDLDDDDLPEDYSDFEAMAGRTDVERFELDGFVGDQGRWTAHFLSY